MALARNINLDVVMRQEGDLWVCHCVQLDLVTAGPFKEKVIRDMRRVVRAAMAYALRTDPTFERTFRPVDKELSRQMALARVENEIEVVLQSTERVHVQVAIAA